MWIILRAPLLNSLRQTCPTFIGKGPQLLLGAGPLASRLKIAVIGISNQLYHQIIFITGTYVCNIRMCPRAA